MKNTRSKCKNILILSLLLTTVAKAQIFTSNDGVSLLNAKDVGEPDVAKGKVYVKKAPSFEGDKNKVVEDLVAAGVSSEIYNDERFLGDGAYSKAIAGMTAVKNTALALKNRPDVAPVGGTVIGSLSDLNTNRAQIEDDVARTFVFKNDWNVDSPIFVGANKTIWVDGVLTYNGNSTATIGGAAFTPRGTKVHAVFMIRHQTATENWQQVQGDGTSPDADRAINKDLKNEIKANKTKNVTIKGTKRGRIVVLPGDEIDVNNITLPKTNGIGIMSGVNILIDGLNIEGGLNGVFLSGSTNTSVVNCNITKSLYRGVHLHGAQNSKNLPVTTKFGYVKHNLVSYSEVDGIDIDSFSARWHVDENIVMGATDRLLIWAEIDANNNSVDNNVGIILPNDKGGFQENGTEASRRGVGAFKGTRDNKWLNNNIFYASKIRHGFTMIKKRFIQFETIEFTNNYVWALNPNIQRFNPKAGVDNDVYYLTGVPEPSLSNDVIDSRHVPLMESNVVKRGEKVKLFSTYNVAVYSSGGILLYTNKGTKIDTASLSEGIYFVLFKLGNGIERRKLIVY